MFSGDYLRASKEEHYGRVMKLKKTKPSESHRVAGANESNSS